MDKQQQELELRAYLALQGAAGAAGNAGDWRNDVAAALRSDAPLSPEFREALASAFEGDMMGIKLARAAGRGEIKRRQDQFGGVIARREWMEIGGWMAAQIEAGSSRSAAIVGAADKFHASDKKCDAALVYFHRAIRWLAGIRASGGDLSGWGDEALLALFEANDAAGKPMDRKPPIAPEME